MNALQTALRATKTVLREIYGLFVDDGVYALSILLWVAAAWLLVGHLHWPRLLDAILLVGGLGAILMASALSFARSKRKPRN